MLVIFVQSYPLFNDICNLEIVSRGNDLPVVEISLISNLFMGGSGNKIKSFLINYARFGLIYIHLNFDLDSFVNIHCSLP